MFTRHDRDLGVKNGMLASVLSVKKNKLTVQLDDAEDALGQTRIIDLRDYADIEHGYATTIHKSQGATVDQSFVLASNSMDRHLSYVAMTRHKKRVMLYSSYDEFRDEAHMLNVLSRKRQKQSTLDYLDIPSPDLACERFKEKRKAQAQGWQQSFSLH